MKKIIICIAGKSGSGKSSVADYLKAKYQIPYLKSYTTRTKRDPTDTGHTFLTEAQFDTLLQHNEPIAITEWNGVRYCCIEKDLSGMDTYVIDERGIDYLVNNFGHKYNIFTVFIDRDETTRRLAVGDERVNRDEGKYYKTLKDYDMVLNGNTTLEGLYRQADIMFHRVNKLFTPPNNKLCRLEDPSCESCQ